MQLMLGVDGLMQRGVAPVTWHTIAMRTCVTLPRIWTRLTTLANRDSSRHHHERVSQLVFQGMIDRNLGGQVTFLIPDSLSDLHALTTSVDMPYGERRIAQRRAQESDIPFPNRRARPDRRLAFRQTFWRTRH